LINYEIKNKFNKNIYGQKLLPFRSTKWNYNIDINNMINDRYNDFHKIKEKLKNMEKEIKESEKYFEKISINNKDYLPEYIKNLKQEEKQQINEIIYNKINTFNLAVTRRNTMKKEIQNILLKSEKKKTNLNINNIENNINNTENTLFTNRNKNKNRKLSNDMTLPTIINKNINNGSEPPPIKVNPKTNTNRSVNKKISKIILRKEDKSYLNTNNGQSKSKIYKKNDIKTINLSNDFIERRFMGYKNEFDEKYNEFKRPLELLLKRNNKNYSKIVNKLPFNNYNNIKNEE